MSFYLGRKHNIKTNAQEVRISQITTFKTFHLGSGTISIFSKESRFQNTRKCTSYPTPCFSEISEEAEDMVDKTETRVTFLPRLQRRAVREQGFQATFRHSYSDQGSYHAVPWLCVNNIIPNDSLVFEVVQNGELAKFQEMLMRGEASLRDQDERGASLIFVSCHHQSCYELRLLC
jgi:hypothetical protein